VGSLTQRVKDDMTCRGGTCDKPGACGVHGGCLYRSSAEEARDVMAGARGVQPAETVGITQVVRRFASGATRNTDEGKLDFEGFLSPRVLKRFAEYMHKHRIQADGSLRPSDNWQKGIPRDAYMKSGWRHFFDWWGFHRSEVPMIDTDEDEEAICALIFNAQGYLHELLKWKMELRGAIPSCPRPK